jgi:hypothetical protein
MTDTNVMVMSPDTKKNILDLNAKWRNYLAGVMGMDPSGPFQVAQGTLGLDTTDSSGLFLMSDALPPASAVGYYDPSSMNRRSKAYRNLLFSLLPETASGLREVLGDMYPTWINWRKMYYENPDHMTDSQEKAFETFANSQLDPIEAKRAITIFQKAELAPLSEAINAYTDKNNTQDFIGSDNKPYHLHKYTATAKAAKQAINNGAGIENLRFDSKTADSTIKSKYIDGAASGFWDIFSGGAGGSYESINEKAASSQITIEGKIDKYATVPTAPLGWYDSNEVNRGLNHKDDNNVWDPNASQNWNDFFKQPKGELCRYVTQFLLVSGYEIKVTIHADFSQKDFEQIKAKAKFGIWPFFSASAEYTQTKEYTLNSDSSLTYTVKLNPGLIQIWGITFQEV